MIEIRIGKYTGSVKQLVDSYSNGFKPFHHPPDEDLCNDYLLLQEVDGKQVGLFIAKRDIPSSEYNLIIIAAGAKKETLIEKIKDFLLKTEIETVQVPDEIAARMEFNDIAARIKEFYEFL